MFEEDELDVPTLQQRIEWDDDELPVLSEVDDLDDSEYLDRRSAGFHT